MDEQMKAMSLPALVQRLEGQKAFYLEEAARSRQVGNIHKAERWEAKAEGIDWAIVLGKHWISQLHGEAQEEESDG